MLKPISTWQAKADEIREIRAVENMELSADISRWENDGGAFATERTAELRSELVFRALYLA